MSDAPIKRRPGERWTEADGVHIEVRGLAPPGPLVTILRLIESLDDSTPVVVHHDRNPVPLYAELERLGWTAQQVEGDAGEFRLRLSRQS